MALMSRLRAARAALGTRTSARPEGPARAVPESVAIIMDGNGRWARRRPGQESPTGTTRRE